MKLLKSVSFCVAALFATCVTATDVHLEVGAGSTKYSIQGDGTWYQDAFQHHLDVRGKAFKVGLTGDAYTADNWGVAWHADYVSLGHISSDCICTPIDADYDPVHHVVIGHTPGVHNADYKGHGIARGGLLSIAPYANVGKWRVGVELGAFVSRVNWDETAYDWMGEAGMQAYNNHVPAPRIWRVGQMTGLFIARGNWRVSYERYSLPSRYLAPDYQPALYTGAQTLMVTYRF